MDNSNLWFTPALVVEDDFAIKVPSDSEEFLVEHELLNRGVLHLANGLADCEADYINHAVESQTADGVLFKLVFTYDSKLYSYLLDTHGPEAINANLWVYLAQDLSWPLRAVVFKDMPIGMLEEVGKDIWEAYLASLQTPEDCMSEILKQLGQRDDIYGAHSLPPELAFGILCYA